ncbi:MAG: RNA 2'-phosphotransferase [Stappiaceae bacterium]
MSNSIKDNTKRSKFLSLVLRHDPAKIGLTLDPEGWADIAELIKKAPPRLFLSSDVIEEIVASSDKQRFKISDDGCRIRANQGHSVKIDLKLTSSTPPAVVYHGTATRFVDAIMKEGLQPGSRNHVHLSLDLQTATKVGKRHGKPVILTVDAQQMVADGFEFFLSENNVWLTAHVPPIYLRLAE